MAEKSGFFDAHLVNGEYDRVYLAESFARYFASFIGNGIFGGKSNELMVQQKATADMSVRVLSGQAWINGYWYENDNELSLAIDVADGVLNRIDTIVLRWDNSERVIRLAVKKGTPATNPSVPVVQRGADFYELKVAQVYIKAGAIKITQADITDTRLNNEVCGFVHGVIDQFDTTDFGKQIDSFIQEFEASNIAKMQAVFARIDSLIDADVAASLAFDVAKLSNDMAIAKQTLGYEKKNLLPYPYASSSVVDKGITWTDNNDGTITANGISTDRAQLDLGSVLLKAGTYIASQGFLADDKGAIMFLSYVENGSAAFIDLMNKTSAQFTLLNDTLVTVKIEVRNAGVVVDNKTFYPMIRRAEIDDGTWEPYKLSVSDMIQEDEDYMGCFYRINRRTGKKEWLNPDCKPGWEYPLVERWNMQPVYQMTFYAASLPNNSAMVLETFADWDRIVSVSGYALDKDDLTSYPFPVTLHNQVAPIAVISRIEGDGSLIITTNGDATYLEAYITVKYTKSF